MFLPVYNSAKILKIHQDFPELWSQMFCHLFMVHSVYAILSVMDSAILQWTVVYTGLDQRSTEELWMLANHISSQLQGTFSNTCGFIIATDDIDNPTLIAHRSVLYHCIYCWRCYENSFRKFIITDGYWLPRSVKLEEEFYLNNKNNTIALYRGEMRSHSKARWRSLPDSLLQFVIFISF